MDKKAFAIWLIKKLDFFLKSNARVKEDSTTETQRKEIEQLMIEAVDTLCEGDDLEITDIFTEAGLEEYLEDID